MKMKVNNKGQTLYYFLIFSLILMMSWAMMFNIAKLIRERMEMQNTADNIALSIATHRARTMNFVAGCNYLIGLVLKCGTVGEFVQLPAYETRIVASYPSGDYRRGSNAALSSGVKFIKKTVDFLQEAQEYAMISHLEYVAETLALTPIKTPYIAYISPSVLFAPNKENAEKYFGLKRNTKGITYKKTENVTVLDVHFVYTEMLFKIFFERLPSGTVDKIKEFFEKVLGIDLSDYTEAPTYAKKDYSWYITDDNFHKQKIKVELYKIQETQPLLHRLFKIQYPFSYARSAAAIYNTKGTMFPDKESELLGPLGTGVSLADEALFLPGLFQFGILAEEIVKYKPAGPFIAVGMGAYILGCHTLILSEWHRGIKNSPISNYLKSKDGGWNAHLVPYADSEENE